MGNAKQFMCKYVESGVEAAVWAPLDNFRPTLYHVVLSRKLVATFLATNTDHE